MFHRSVQFSTTATTDVAGRKVPATAHQVTKAEPGDEALCTPRILALYLAAGWELVGPVPNPDDPDNPSAAILFQVRFVEDKGEFAWTPEKGSGLPGALDPEPDPSLDDDELEGLDG